jgi:hypothetical protein
MKRIKPLWNIRHYFFLGIINASLINSASSADFLDNRVDIKFMLMQGFQAIEANPDAFEISNTDMAPGFQRLRFNLELAVKIHDHVTAYVDLGEEPNDFGSDDQFEISQDLGYIDLDIFGLAGNTQQDQSWLFRAGNIVSTVFDYRGYSDGAAVQSNPLIGNSPIDFVTAESGIQSLWSQKLTGSTITQVNADIGMSVPTFFEDYSGDRGFNLFGRASFNTDFGLDLGLGWFISNLGDQVTSRAFSDVQTAGLIQGDGDNYNFAASGASSRDTHAGLLPGLDVNILQINAHYQANPSTAFRAWAGIAKDDFSFIDNNGNQTVGSQAVAYQELESEIHYYAVEVVHYVKTDSLYLASRYSSVTNNSDNVSGDADLTRFQLGLGWWLTENTLFKTEYVKQTEGNASAGQIGSDWDGLSAELSVLFD